MIAPTVFTATLLFLRAGAAVGAESNGTNAFADGSSKPVPDPHPGAERPARIDAIPPYKDFYDRPQLYRRLHILLDGIERKAELTLPWNINSPDAYAIAETVGPESGSTHYFPIGSHQFSTVGANNDEDGFVFSWDAKSTLIYRTNGTDAVRIQVLDEDFLSGDDLLHEVMVPVAEFPPVGEDYVEYRMTSEVQSQYRPMEGSELIFRLKVTEGADKVTTEADLRNSMQSVDGVLEYGEHVLELQGGDKALLQSWVHTDGRDVRGAALWVIGRNDAFVHPHVLRDVFGVGGDSADGADAKSFDVFVLNWRENGLSMHRGWVTDAFLITHNKYGDFTHYNEEMGLALDKIRQMGTYDHLVGYGHSTGCTILLNYILDHGEDDFDAFVFNSPFLDWGYVGGDLYEFAMETLPGFLTDIDVWELDKMFKVKDVPDELKEDPIVFLGREIVPRGTSQARSLSQHYMGWSMRPLYHTPITAGFIVASVDVFEKFKDAPKPFTSKLTLVLVSDGDHLLDPQEMIELSGDVLTNRTLVRFKYNGHDVFLSQDAADTELAINVTSEWIQAGLESGFVSLVGGNSTAGTDGDSSAGTNGESSVGTDGESSAGTDGEPSAGTDGEPSAGTDGEPSAGTDGEPSAGTDGEPSAGTDGKSSAGTDGKSSAGTDGESFAETDGESSAETNEDSSAAAPLRVFCSAALAVGALLQGV